MNSTGLYKSKLLFKDDLKELDQRSFRSAKVIKINPLLFNEKDFCICNDGVIIFPPHYNKLQVAVYTANNNDRFSEHTNFTEFFDWYCDNLNIRMNGDRILNLFKQLMSKDVNSVKMAQSVLLYLHSDYTPIKNLIFTLINHLNGVWYTSYKVENKNDIERLFAYNKCPDFARTVYEQFKNNEHSDFLLEHSIPLFRYLKAY